MLTVIQFQIDYYCILSLVQIVITVGILWIAFVSQMLLKSNYFISSQVLLYQKMYIQQELKKINKS